MTHSDNFEDISSSSSAKETFHLSKTTEKAFNEDDNTAIPNGDESARYTEGDKSMSSIKIEKGVSLNRYTRTQAKRKAKTKLIAFNIVVSTLLVLSIFSTFVMGVVAYYTGDGSYQQITQDKTQLGINEEAKKLPKEVVNIALFGLDSRSKVTENRKKPLSGLADTVIILSVDLEHNTVKMVSVLRDSWVDVDGTMRKINAAYAYGGAPLAIKTLNYNFGLNITDYVSVSLHQLWKVVDLVCEAEGSKIQIRITEAERKQLNYLANSEGFGVNKLDKAGLVELDGGQAMTYARIRKIDGDGVRALRQQKILNCLFEKAKAIPLTKYPALLKEVMKNVETSLSYDEIFKFAPLLAGGSLSLESKTIPGDTIHAEGKIFSDTRGAWVWKYDLDEAKKYIHEYLYGI